MEFLGSIHPAVVHFPIAFFVLYALFENAGHWLNNEHLLNAAMYTLGAGIFVGLLAVLTGNQAAEVVARLSEDGAAIPRELIEDHEFWASLSFWYYFVIFVSRGYLFLKKKIDNNMRIVFAVCSLVGIILIYEAGRMGGELVFKYGAGTEILK